MEKIIEEGITYIADRGYYSFALADQVMQANAFFVFRGKDNLLCKRLAQVGERGEIAKLFQTGDGRDRHLYGR